MKIDKYFHLYSKGKEVLFDEIPARIKAKWVEYDFEHPFDWQCSHCGAVVEQDEQRRHYWKYCYHCGAEMEIE